jgi:Flp pilus assembly protein TadG
MRIHPTTTAGPRRIAKRPSARRAGRRGAALVEFALTLPIFFLFLLASFEFGWTNVLRHTADNAAYEAARHAMVPGATAAEAKDKANSILGILGTRNAKVTVNPSTLTPETKQVTVTVEVPMDSNGLIVPQFMRGKKLRSNSTLRTERAE